MFRGALATLLLALSLSVATTSTAGTLAAIPDLTTASSGAVTIDITTDIDVIQFDLHASWDVGYWTLTDIIGAGAVERDDTLGFIDDIFGDVGTGDPITAGSPLFALVFDVIGNPAPGRTVLEVGNLTSLDPFFDRTVLLADPSFNIQIPPADRSGNALVMTPEPGTMALLATGIGGLAWNGRRRRA